MPNYAVVLLVVGIAVVTLAFVAIWLIWRRPTKTAQAARLQRQSPKTEVATLSATVETSGTPGWAPALNAAQFERFMQLVREYFQQSDIPFHEDDGWIIANHIDREEPLQFGLTNLSQLCSQMPGDDWQSVIAEHFDGIMQSWTEQTEFEERLKDWNEARPRLALRIWPAETLSNLNETPHCTDFAHTATTPVFDMSFGIRNVQEDEINNWGKTFEDVLAVGLSNVRAMGDLPDPEPALEREYGTVYVFNGESFFVATMALFLDDFPNVIGKHGSLVGIPTRHSLLSYPINNIQVVDAIQEMIPIIMGLERDGPGSISHHLYWFHDGEFTLLPVEITDTKLTFSPPEEFVELLNQLAKDD